MDAKYAFKCRDLTSEQEAEVGVAMAAHEMVIDRTYLDARLNSATFPNRTVPATKIIRAINSYADGSTILSSDLTNGQHAPATVNKVINKLLDCGGITLKRRLENGRCIYVLTPKNRHIIEGILCDGGIDYD